MGLARIGRSSYNHPVSASGVPLPVVLDYTPALSGWGGIRRYARELARDLARPERNLDLALFAADPETAEPAPELPVVRRIVRRRDTRAWRAEVAWAHWTGRTMDREVGAAPGVVFHATDHLLPPLSRDVPAVMTLHDIGFVRVPETHALRNRLYLSAMMGRFLARADHVLSMSEFSKREVVAHYGTPEAKITVIPPGVIDHFAPRASADVERVRARYGLPGRYVLTVGTLEPRKNMTTAIAAFEAAAIPDVSLVLVGPPGWRLRQAIGPHLAAGGSRKGVVLAGKVDDTDLAALYTGAAAFLFPTLYEGFGVPVLEAMACGTPVLASDVASLPEVAGDAALLLPPKDVRAWADALRLVLGDPGRAADLAARGPARAALFPWTKAGRDTAALYARVRAGRP